MNGLAHRARWCAVLTLTLLILPTIAMVEVAIAMGDWCAAWRWKERATRTREWLHLLCHTTSQITAQWEAGHYFDKEKSA